MTTTFLLGLVLVVSAPLKDPPKKDDPIVGEWLATAAYSGDMSLHDPDDPAIMTFTNDGRLILVESKKKYESTYKTDASKKPAEIDFSSPTNKKRPKVGGIYKIEGDTLTICTPLDSDTRPTVFESKKENDYPVLTILRRVKKD